MNQDILVLTATLGERDTLSRTIETVRNIGGNSVRHIIICPNDKIDFIKNKYGNIDCLAEPPKGKGIYAALNYGFQTYGKEYKYLTFINDDDYWLPDFKELIETIKNDDSLDLVYARVKYVNENNVMIGCQSCCPFFSSFVPLLKYNVMLLTQQATLIKNSLFFKIGGFDETYKLVADTKFWALASMMNVKSKYVNKVCAAYAIQMGQLSSDSKLQNKEHTRLLEELNCRKSKGAFSLMKYRLYNLPIYYKRLMGYKGHIKSSCVARTGVFLKVMIVLLPWKLKRYLLNKYFLYDIAPTAKIGLSYIFPDFLKMDDGSQIGHFNIGIHLSKIILGNNSSISRGNWITGFPIGTDSDHFAHDKSRKNELIIGAESAITKNHHFDCTNAIHIGDFVTIAGYNSQFLTHSIDVYNNRQDSHPITIGNYCFVSTGVKVLGGSSLPDYSILAAGAVLNKAFVEKNKLYGGVPAEVKKHLHPDDVKYFHREKGFVV